MDRRTLLAAAGAAAVLPHGVVRAQAFPSRPISIYVAFPAGGPTDQVFRAIAEGASKILGQSVVVENKPGGGGTLAPIAAKNAKPDGYVVSQSHIQSASDSTGWAPHGWGSRGRCSSRSAACGSRRHRREMVLVLPPGGRMGGCRCL